jgi:hypothetical protein
MCIHLYLWHSWIEATRDQLYALTRETSSTLTYGLHRIRGWSGAFVSPTIVDIYDVCNGGPLAGNQRNNMLINLWFHVRR